MQIRSVLLAASLTTVIALPGAAHAAPKGWTCQYSSTPLITSPIFGATRINYACYGRNLRKTRNRARVRCHRLRGCSRGACFPLTFTPRKRCQRE